MTTETVVGDRAVLRARLLELEVEHEQLRLKAAAYDAVVGQMDEGVCILQLLEDEHGQLHDYRYLMYNEACARHTLHAKHVGSTAREIIPDEVDQWLPHFVEVARTGVPLQFEKRLAVSNRWLTLKVSRLEPASERRLLVRFTGKPGENADISELQAINHELSLQIDKELAGRRLLGNLVDHSVANVFAADCNFRLLAINRTAQETFKRWRGVVPQVGQYIPDFIAEQPDIVKQLSGLWPRVMAGESFVDTVAVGVEAAIRYYEVRYNPLLGPDQTLQGGFMFAYDITERVAEQQRLQQVEETLRQSQKLEAIGQLTGGISHDFNNLLGSIMGALEVAAQRQAECRYADAARLMGLARQDTRRAATLVQRLLTFTRQQNLTPQTVDVHYLVASMHDLIKSSLHASIEFQDLTTPGRWLVQVDPCQLENALLNLCINARDAMPLGGTLMIRNNDVHVHSSLAENLHLPVGDYVRISVSDDGAGMSGDVADRALEPFFTTKPLGQGSGLGLSMVYGFIRQSEGQVKITSTQGQGTCVDLYLPKDIHQAVPKTTEVRTPPCPHSPGKHLVMLVEDEGTLRLVIEELLIDQGMDVRAFAEGRQALDALKAGLQPSLLITDIGLPGGINGKQLETALPDAAALLYITGYADELGMALPRRGAVMCKPFALTALVEQVVRLLGEADPGPDARTP
nr:ATP-binding protein [uncultured Pseudomonas sp.]